MDDLVAPLVEELPVDGPDGHLGPDGRDDDGNVPLGRALRRGADRDAVRPQGGQHPARGAAVPEDVVPDQAHEREARLHLERIQPAQRDLIGEAGIGRLAGRLGVLLGDGDAHRMDRRGLGDEDDVDSLPAQRVEQARREARNAHHAAALQGDEGDVVGMGDADHAVPHARRVPLHQRTRFLRVEGILDDDRNSLVHNGLDGRRIDDLGPEMGQFLRRPVGDVRNRAGGRDDLRIGRHDARDVGPDLHAAGVDAHGHERGREVGAAAAERRHAAVPVRGDEARDDEQFHVRVRIHGLGHAGVGFRLVHLPVAHLDEGPGVEPLASDAQRQELVRQDGRGEQLAEALDGFQARLAQFAQEIHAVRDALQGFEQFVHGSGRPLPVSFRQQFADDLVMALPEVLDERLVGLVAGGRLPAGLDQRVRTSAHGREKPRWCGPLRGPCGRYR